MKHFFTFVFLLLLFFSCEGKKDAVMTTSDPNEMGEEVFKAIKTNDLKTIEKYLATPNDIEERLSQSNLSEENKEKKTEKYNKRVKELRKALPSLIKELDQYRKGFKDAIYEGITYKNYQKDSVTLADISLVYSNNSIKNKIKLKSCYLTKRGWVMFKGINYKHPQ